MLDYYFWQEKAGLRWQHYYRYITGYRYIYVLSRKHRSLLKRKQSTTASFVIYTSTSRWNLASPPIFFAFSYNEFNSKTLVHTSNLWIYVVNILYSSSALLKSSIWKHLFWRRRCHVCFQHNESSVDSV